VATARFIDTASLVNSGSFTAPVAPAKKVGVIAWLWPLLAAAFLLLLVCCCLVLFLVWRRRRTEYSTKADEAGVEPGPFMFEPEDEPFYPHEYWNPLDDSASGALMLDMGDGEEDVLELSGDDFFHDNLDISEPSVELEAEGPEFGHEYWNPLDDAHELSDGVFADAHAASRGDKTSHEADVESGELGADELYSDPGDSPFADRPSSDKSRAFASDSAYSGWGLDSEGSHLNLSPDFEETLPGGLEEEDFDDIASDTQDPGFEDDYGFE
jgi:hypothetical protein